jgi:hypothetical protein
MATLNNAWQTASTEMYSAANQGGASADANPQQGANQQQSGGKSEPEVTDVPFEEVK